MIAELEKRARALKRDAYALYIAARDPRVPWYAKVFLGLVLAHTFSPIDLIPDFVPILGYLDDLVITPLGIVIALKMIPPEVISEARQQSEELLRQGKPISRVGALLVIAVWLIIITAIVWSIVRVVF
ncbi:MAG: YkvA family protein [Anaerolineae bacterium]|nr:YkvA family protein [Anaerolineae bacterium]